MNAPGVGGFKVHWQLADETKRKPGVGMGSPWKQQRSRPRMKNLQQSVSCMRLKGRVAHACARGRGLHGALQLGDGSFA